MLTKIGDWERFLGNDAAVLAPMRVNDLHLPFDLNQQLILESCSRLRYRTGVQHIVSVQKTYKITLRRGKTRVVGCALPSVLLCNCFTAISILFNNVARIVGRAVIND